MTNYSRNIPLLYAYSVLIKRVSMPIIVLYFLLNNLSFTQIGILAAVMLIVKISIEVPGGIFADTYGKKISLILHSSLATLTMFFYFIGDSFYYFLIASVLYGLSGAFITGTRNALLYDTLIKIKKTSEFKKFNGKMIFYSHFFNAIVLLLIPVMYNYDAKLPFMIGILFFIASIIVALFMIESIIPKKEKMSVSKYFSKSSTSLKEIFQKPRLLTAFLFMLVVFGFLYMSSEFVQPLLQISGLQVVYFGVIYALMRFIQGLISKYTYKFERFISSEYLLVIGFGLIVIGFIGFSLGSGIIIILSVLLLKVAESFNRVVLEDEINMNIESANRTTILSITSLSYSLFQAILVFFAGIVADLAGVQEMFLYVTLMFVLILFLSATLLNRKLKKTSQQ